MKQDAFKGILFYLLWVAGLILFAVAPALESGDWVRALLLGAAFGFITYATYDLTNLATLRDWPLLLTLVDLAWGTVLGGVVGTVSYLLGRNVLGM